MSKLWAKLCSEEKIIYFILLECVLVFHKDKIPF